jgi:hypothetical protein
MEGSDKDGITKITNQKQKVIHISRAILREPENMNTKLTAKNKMKATNLGNTSVS